jgi:hypothetical protein
MISSRPPPVGDQRHSGRFSVLGSPLALVVGAPSCERSCRRKNLWKELLVQPAWRLRDHVQGPHPYGHGVRRCRRRSCGHQQDRSVRVAAQSQTLLNQIKKEK